MKNVEIYEIENLSTTFFKNLKQDFIDSPFYDLEILKLLSKFYKVKCEIAIFKTSPEFLICYMIKKIKNVKFLFTQGRFGQLGISSKKKRLVATLN